MSRELAGHEVVVVGGGPAGASAACHLVRAGRSVLLLERETEPRHKICGEFVSIEAQAALADLGIDAAARGVPIRRSRLVHGEAVAEADLPFEGVGLTRRRLDEALLEAAESAGVTVRRGETVREIESREGVRLLLSGGRALAPPTVFLATGKHEVRGAKRDTAGCTDDLIGFKMYFGLAPAEEQGLCGHIEVILFDGGYAGLQQVEGRMANLCLLARRGLFERVEKSWDRLLAHLIATIPHLAHRLAGATPLLERPLTIFQIPYGFVHAPGARDAPNLFRLGDQAAVIPSFAGDGIAIALHTGRLAAATYLAHGNDAARFHAQARRDVRRQVQLASWLYRMAEAPTGRLALTRVSQAWPGMMRFVATRTRVPERARSRAARLLQGAAAG